MDKFQIEVLVVCLFLCCLWFMKSPLGKSLISLLQKCTLKGKSQRSVGKQPALTVLIVLTNIFFLLSYTLFSDRKRLQFHSNQEPNPGLYPGNPASEQVSHSHLSQPLSAFVYLQDYNKSSLSSFFVFPSASLRKALSIQNLSQIEKPWENVTLNRCLFVAISILVLTSGFQRLHGK